jgi:hypothetical protein
VLHCSNLPISIYRGEIRFAGEAISASGLLDRVQQELNSQIDKMRENGSPLAEVTDIMILTDIILEKEFDRPDDILVYLLARKGCMFNATIFKGLKDVVLGLARNELTEDHLFSAYLRAAFPWDWLRTAGLDTGESSGPRSAERGTPRADPELFSNVSELGSEVSKDKCRPIVIDGEHAGIARIDTGPLREVQLKLNAFINRICSSKHTGNQVFETHVFLSHILETEFYSRDSDRICSPQYVDLLAAASAAEAKSPDAGDALQELTLIAECIARDELSVADLTQFRRSTDRQDDTSTPTD